MAAAMMLYAMQRDQCSSDMHQLDDTFYVPSVNVKPYQTHPHHSHHHHHHHHHHHRQHQHHHPNKERRARERRAATLSERHRTSNEPRGLGKKSSSARPNKPSFLRRLFGKLRYRRKQ